MLNPYTSAVLLVCQSLRIKTTQRSPLSSTMPFVCVCVCAQRERFKSVAFLCTNAVVRLITLCCTHHVGAACAAASTCAWQICLETTETSCNVSPTLRTNVTFQFAACRQGHRTTSDATILHARQRHYPFQYVMFRSV